MPLRLKEDPKEWRRVTLLTALGLALLSSLLRWRQVLSPVPWVVVLGALSVVAIGAWLWPRVFRGFYRVSTRLGFWMSQVLARVILTLVFVLVLTPLALLLRASGKDLLRLKRSPDARTYWSTARENSPFDRLF